MFRRLDDHTVACSQGSNDGFDGQEQREVPRGNHEHDTFGLGHNFRAGAHQLKRGIAAFGPHPIPQMLADVLNFLADRKVLRQPCLRLRLAEVFVQSIQQPLFMCPQSRQHVRQHRLPLLVSRNGMGRLSGPQCGEYTLQRCAHSLSNSLMLPKLPIMPLAS